MIVIDASAMIAMLFGEPQFDVPKRPRNVRHIGTRSSHERPASVPAPRTLPRGPARFLDRSLESVVVFYPGACRQVCHRLRPPSKKTHNSRLWKIVARFAR